MTETADTPMEIPQSIANNRARTIDAFLGIELVSYDEQSLELRMPITDKVRQPFGLLHGGVNMVMAESAASFHAALGVNLEEFVPVGVEINGSHVGMAREGTVKAVASLVKRSRRLVVHTVEISLIESGELLCTARVTNYIKSIKA